MINKEIKKLKVKKRSKYGCLRNYKNNETKDI